jgi:hypothetical protein
MFHCFLTVFPSAVTASRSVLDTFDQLLLEALLQILVFISPLTQGVCVGSVLHYVIPFLEALQDLAAFQIIGANLAKALAILEQPHDHGSMVKKTPSECHLHARDGARTFGPVSSTTGYPM